MCSSDLVTESGYTILEVSRTGRMAMRRGHHTSRVLKALGTPPDSTTPTPAEIIPHEFEDIQAEEE